MNIFTWDQSQYYKVETIVEINKISSESRVRRNLIHKTFVTKNLRKKKRRIFHLFDFEILFYCKWDHNMFAIRHFFFVNLQNKKTKKNEEPYVWWDDTFFILRLKSIKKKQRTKYYLFSAVHNWSICPFL